MKSNSNKVVLAVLRSENNKLGGPTDVVSATYAPQVTCPPSCPLRGAGCYAEKGNAGVHTARITRNAEGMLPIEVAYEEARLIDALFVGGQPLRLHVVGDCPDEESCKIVSAAATRFMKRGGGSVWTYTHAWREVRRSTWMDVSVLASIHTPKQVYYARRMGYAPALVVDAFPDSSGKAFKVKGTSTKFVPCPAQTRDVKCAKCRLCMNADGLFKRNMGIAFEKH